MRIDLFEFFESTFRGLVYFFYNVIETLWVLVRRPWRGPALLYRCYTQRGRQQIGGLTYLFLVFFTIIGLLSQLDSVDANWSKALSKAPKLDTDQVWITLLSAVASTVLIDCAARLYFLWRIPNGKGAASRGRQLRRRKRRVAQLEYALVLPTLLVPLSAVALLILVISSAFTSGAIPIPFGLALPAWLAICALACVPALSQLAMKPRPRDRTRLRRGAAFVGRVVAELGVAGFVIAALLLGGWVMSKLSDAQPVPPPKPPEGQLETVALRCIVDGAGRLHVDVTLTNPTDAPVTYNLRIAPAVRISRIGQVLAEPILLNPADRFAAPVVFQSGQSQLVRLEASRETAAALQNGDRCSFGDVSWELPRIEFKADESIEFTSDKP